MYTTVIITKKEIIEQQEWILLTVELTSDSPVKKLPNNPVKEFVMDGEEVKLGKDGKPKEKKAPKEKFPTKTIYFKFPIATAWDDMHLEIKAKVKAIEQCESNTIPIGIPLDMN